MFEHMQVIHSHHPKFGKDRYFTPFDGCEQLHLVVVTYSSLDWFP